MKFKIFIFLLLTSCTNNLLSQNNVKIDSLKNILNNITGYEEKGITLMKLINELSNEDEEALIFSTELKDIALRHKMHDEYIFAVNVIGNIFFKKGLQNKALDTYNNQLYYGKSNNNKFGMAKAYQNLAKLYLKQGYELKALNYFEQSIKIFKEINDVGEVLISKSNIAEMYINNQEYENAYIVYFELLDFFADKNNIEVIANTYNHIGIVKFHEGKFEEAITFYKKGLKIFLQTKNQLEIAICYGNLAEVYEITGNYNKALKLYFKALKIEENYNYKSGIAFLYSGIAKTYNNKQDINKALKYYKKGLKLTLEINEGRMIIETYKNISNLYAQNHSFDSAYTYRIKYDQFKDSMFGVEKMKTLKDIEAKYDFAHKENEIKYLKENINKTNEINRTKKLYTRLIIAALSVISILLIIILRIRIRKKEKDILLIKTEDKLKDLFFNIPVGIYRTNYEGEILQANPALIKMLGYSNIEELFKINVKDTFKDKEQRKNELKHLSNRKIIEKYRLKLKKKNGEIIDILDSTRERKNENGEIIYEGSFIDITELKKAEQEIKKLSHAIEHSSVTIIITDTKGNIKYANPAFTEICGYTAEEAVGKNPSILKSGHTSPKVYKELWSTISSGETWKGQFLNNKKNKEKYWENAVISPVTDERGEIINYIAIKEDITKLKIAENKSKIHSQNLNIILNTIKTGAYISSGKFKIEYLNNEMQKIIGYNAVGEKCYKAIYKLNSPCIWCYYKELKSKKNNTTIKMDVNNNFYEIKSTLLKNNSKLTLYSDITTITSKNFELKTIKQKAKEQENQLKEAEKKTNFGLWKFHHNINKLIWTDETYQIFNLEKKTFNPSFENWLSIIHPNDKEAVYNMLQISSLTKETKDAEFRIYSKKTGKYKHFHLTCKHSYDNSDKKHQSSGMIVDITDRKNAEEKLLKLNHELIISEERFKKLSDLTFEGILIHNKGNVIDVNTAFCKLTGYTNNELIGINVKKNIISEKYHSLIYSNIKKTYIKPLEIEIIRKDGKIIPVEIEAVNINNKNKDKVTAFRDLTQKKETEKRIMSAILTTEEKQKRKFAIELHDGLGPVLSSVNLYTQAIKLSKNPDKINNAIDKIQNSIEEAINTVQEISNNISPHILQNFGLNVALESFFNKIKNLNKINIYYTGNIQERFEDEIEINIYRILNELINNTLKYAKATTITVNIKQNNNMLFVNYQDNGVGFDIQEKINSFDGMGISNIYSRIKSLSGKILLISHKNEGMICKITINLK